MLVRFAVGESHSAASVEDILSLRRSVEEYIRANQEMDLSPPHFEGNDGEYDKFCVRRLPFLLSESTLELEVLLRCSGGPPKVIPYVLNTEEPDDVIYQNTTLYTLLNLPHASLHGLHDSIILPPGVKDRLWSFVQTAKELARSGVDENTIASHHMVLLHSPPGCGKTSIATSLAHELSMSLCETTVAFNSAVLVTVSAHALFSKWFSESGKIITKMFQDIAEEAAGGKDVYILIDEIESLAASRAASVSHGEPSDAVRAANAMLTQLDSIRRHRNVFIFCTTNMLDVLDSAFIDRCDDVIGLGTPVDGARRQILSCIVWELLHRGCLEDDTNTPGFSDALAKAVHASVGLSGRRLRKLPINALVWLRTRVQEHGNSLDPQSLPTASAFLCALASVSTQ